MYGESLEKAIGLDPSESAIKYMEETRKLSNFEKIEYKVGDSSSLATYDDESFDLIISSNVLDCIPPAEAKKAIKELVRLMNKEAIFFLKVNFYLEEEKAIKSGLKPIGNNCYEQNDVFRIGFFENEYWINLFEEEGLTLLKKDEFQRIPSGPKDRIFVFKK